MFGRGYISFFPVYQELEKSRNFALIKEEDLCLGAVMNIGRGRPKRRCAQSNTASAFNPTLFLAPYSSLSNVTVIFFKYSLVYFGDIVLRVSISKQF